MWFHSVTDITAVTQRGSWAWHHGSSDELQFIKRGNWGQIVGGGLHRVGIMGDGVTRS